MAQFEVGQQELINVHQYMYIIDMYAMKNIDVDSRVKAVNYFLHNQLLFSTCRSD